MFKKAILPLFIVAALSGCNDGTADGTSQVALSESLGKMTTKIQTHEKQAQFADDVALLKKNYEMSQLQIDLNGKNAEQIMQVAADLRVKLDTEQKQKEEAEAAQQALIAEQAKASTIAKIQAELKDLSAKLDAENYKKLITVSNAKFTTVKNEVTGEFDPIISLAVTNNGDRVFYSATLDGTLVGPNDTTPIFSGPLELEVEDGLKNGESQDLQIKPTLISDWRSITAPEGSVLTLTVKDIKDKAGESLVNGLSFTEEDNLRIKDLMQQLMALDPEGFKVQAESIPAAPASAPEASKDGESNPVEADAPSDAAETPVADSADAESVTDEPAPTIQEVEALEAASAAESTPAQAMLPETEVKAPAHDQAEPAAAAKVDTPEFDKIQAPAETAAVEAAPAPAADAASAVTPETPSVAPTKNF